MDQRELDSRVKALQKAISEKEPVANIISIMQTLKNDVLPTEELLRATKAGMVVAKQRANPNKDVSRLAAEIVAKWKKTVEAEKARKVKMAAGSPGNGNGNGNSSPAPAQSSDTKSYKGDKSKRKWETDEVNTKRTNDAARDACIGLLYNGLAYMSEETPASVLVKAMEIEAAAFEAYKGTTADYKTKLRSLFQNLKNASNRELGPKIMSGEIAPAKFVIMTHEELKSTEQKKQDEKLNVENMKKAQVPMAEKSISDALRCGRCGQKKVSYSQAQTRSADEPMTTFCECTVCGNRWKFS